MKTAGKKCLILLAVTLTALPVRGEERAGTLTVNGIEVPDSVVASEYNWIYAQRSMFHPVDDQGKFQIRQQAIDRCVVWEIVRQKLAA